MEDKMKLRIMEQREVMKGYTDADANDEVTDQESGLPQPALDKACPGSPVISLPRDFEDVLTKRDIMDVLEQRTSRRQYADGPLSLKELAFLLWSSLGVKKVIGKRNHATLRTVPSAGARHPLELYVFVTGVEGLSRGLYHYLALEHKLEYLGEVEDQENRVTAACCGQTFAGTAPATFFWTAVPYRSEWRYQAKAQKYILLDAGHSCENLYLACEAAGCGPCAIGAYEQPLADALLNLPTGPSYDNDSEFVIYIAPVGKI